MHVKIETSTPFAFNKKWVNFAILLKMFSTKISNKIKVYFLLFYLHEQKIDEKE